MAKKNSAPQTSTGGKEINWLVIRLTCLATSSRLRVSVGFAPTSPIQKTVELAPLG
ncbi:MAG: hypothetical protein RL590_332 [Actinomycetota bacterium]|jgi:hypothetical protein